MHGLIQNTEMIRFCKEHPLDNFQAEMTQVTEPKLMPFTRLSACDVFYYLHQVFLGQLKHNFHYFQLHQ